MVEVFAEASTRARTASSLSAMRFCSLRGGTATCVVELSLGDMAQTYPAVCNTYKFIKFLIDGVLEIPCSSIPSSKSTRKKSVLVEDRFAAAPDMSAESIGRPRPCKAAHRREDGSGRRTRQGSDCRARLGYSDSESEQWGYHVPAHSDGSKARPLFRVHKEPIGACSHPLGRSVMPELPGLGSHVGLEQAPTFSVAAQVWSAHRGRQEPGAVSVAPRAAGASRTAFPRGAWARGGTVLWLAAHGSTSSISSQTRPECRAVPPGPPSVPAWPPGPRPRARAGGRRCRRCRP